MICYDHGLWSSKWLDILVTYSIILQILWYHFLDHFDLNVKLTFYFPKNVLLKNFLTVKLNNWWRETKELLVVVYSSLQDEAVS